MIRVVFDVNVLISYLLGPASSTTISLTVEVVFGDSVRLVLPLEVIQEFADKVATKRYLVERITSERANELIQALAEVAEVVPPLGTVIPALSRDFDDDYLLFQSVANAVDYLVSGDKDLQDLREIDGIPIVSPAEFVQILRELGIFPRDQESPEAGASN